MKILCDCGEITELKEDGEMHEDSFYATPKGNIKLLGEHDEIYITCYRCDKSIYIIT